MGISIESTSSQVSYGLDVERKFEILYEQFLVVQWSLIAFTIQMSKKQIKSNLTFIHGYC